MLRSLILLLIALNGAYVAWTQGYLAQFGWAPAPVNEPHRIALQVKPDAIRLMSPELTKKTIAENAASIAERGITDQTDGLSNPGTGPAAPASATAAIPPICLVSGVLDEAQSKGVLAALDGHLSADTWRIDATPQPARWILYMGKFESTDLVTRKRGELRALNVPTEAVRNPAMEPGVSLGGHDTQAAANAALAKLATRGVRTARVVQERTEQRGFTLHVPESTEAMRGKLDGLKTLLGDKGLQPCPAAVTTSVNAATTAATATATGSSTASTATAVAKAATSASSSATRSASAPSSPPKTAP